MVKVVKAPGADDIAGAQLEQLLRGVNSKIEGRNFIVENTLFSALLAKVLALIRSHFKGTK